MSKRNRPESYVNAIIDIFEDLEKINKKDDKEQAKSETIKNNKKIYTKKKTNEAGLSYNMSLVKKREELKGKVKRTTKQFETASSSLDVTKDKKNNSLPSKFLKKESGQKTPTSSKKVIKSKSNVNDKIHTIEKEKENNLKITPRETNKESGQKTPTSSRKVIKPKGDVTDKKHVKKNETEINLIGKEAYVQIKKEAVEFRKQKPLRRSISIDSNKATTVIKFTPEGSNKEVQLNIHRISKRDSITKNHNDQHVIRTKTDVPVDNKENDNENKEIRTSRLNRFKKQENVETLRNKIQEELLEFESKGYNLNIMDKEINSSIEDLHDKLNEDVSRCSEIVDIFIFNDYDEDVTNEIEGITQQKTLSSNEEEIQEVLENKPIQDNRGSCEINYELLDFKDDEVFENDYVLLRKSVPSDKKLYRTETWFDPTKFVTKTHVFDKDNNVRITRSVENITGPIIDDNLEDNIYENIDNFKQNDDMYLKEIDKKEIEEKEIETIEKNIQTEENKPKPKYQNLIIELLLTEYTYQNGLKKVIFEYIQHWELKFKNSMPYILESIFKNIKAIYNETCIFGEKIEKCGEDYNSLADVFLNSKKLFDLYPIYCKNKRCLTHLLNNIWKDYVEEREDALKHSESLNLSSYLLTPIQRLPRYKLILDNIVKDLKKHKKDYELVQKASKFVGDYTKLSDDAIVINLIKFQPKDLGDFGKLLKSDDFTLLKPRRFEATIFLFENIIIFTSKAGEEFDYKYSINVTDMSLQMGEGGRNIHLVDFAKNKTSKDKSAHTFVMQAKSLEVKNIWLQAIEKVLWNQLEQQKEKLEMQYQKENSDNKSCSTSSNSTISEIEIKVFQEKETSNSNRKDSSKSQNGSSKRSESGNDNSKKNSKAEDSLLNVRQERSKRPSTSRSTNVQIPNPNDTNLTKKTSKSSVSDFSQDFLAIRNSPIRTSTFYVPLNKS